MIEALRVYIRFASYHLINRKETKDITKLFAIRESKISEIQFCTTLYKRNALYAFETRRCKIIYCVKLITL